MQTTNLKPKAFYFIVALLLFSCANEDIEDIELIETTNLNELASAKIIVDDSLDYGLYWFNEHNESVKGFDENNNTAIDVASSYYNASQPTLIFFHGWQPLSSIQNYNREDFYFDDGNVNTVQFWKDKGWNIAIFYWNQFADELEVKNAEAKIWDAENGPKKMRYLLSNGTYSELQSPTQNLADLAANQINITVGDNTSNNVRFAGHSLGAQLDTNTAYIISDRINSGAYPATLEVDRLELLDPFWSADDKSYLENDWTGERSREYIDTMISRNNTAITWYSSSLILDIGIGDSNEDLKDKVAYQSVRPWYVNPVDIIAKHINVRHSYFWSLNFDAPKEVAINWLFQKRDTGKPAASATTETARIREMMGDNNYWDQVKGRYTATPEDDEFQIK